MQTVDINNFLALVGAAENDEAKPKAAPFGMKENETQKVIFKYCRARNFRSIGNEFMQIDFNKSKSTLIISEDNGSGKSTMAVWAPYYALFDKAYAPKEKKGGLINSSTRKDMLVEIVFNTKGKEYMVRRGAKPTVFEILFMSEEGSWIKIEEEAAQRDQQAYLENILGFDAKIAENVMILGADKFTPFVEMDAPSRRHVVEQIWDLSVFPVMLRIAKEDLAVEDRKIVECSAELTRLTTQRENDNRRLDEVNSHAQTIIHLFGAAETALARCKDNEKALVDIPAQYEADRAEAQTTLDAVNGELEVLRSEVGQRFESKLADAEASLASVKAVSAEAEKVATASVDLAPLTEAVKGAEAARDQEAGVIKKSAHAEYLTLLPAKEEAERKADGVEARIRASRVFVRNLELLVQLDQSASKESEHRVALTQNGALIDETALSKNGAVGSRDAAKIRLSTLRQQKEFLDSKRAELDIKVSEFAHLGQCPTCRQAIGDEAITKMKEGLETEYASLGTKAIEGEITSVLEALAKTEESLTELESKGLEYQAAKLSIISEIDSCRAESERLSSLLAEEKHTFDKQTEVLVADARVSSSVEVNNANAAIKALADATKVKLIASDAKWGSIIEERKTALATVESTQRAKVAEVRAESQKAISAAESVLANIKSDYNSEFHQAASELSARAQALTTKLKDLEFTANAQQKLALDALAENQFEYDSLIGKAKSESNSNDEKRQSLELDILAIEGDIANGELDLNELTLRAKTYRHLINNELGDKAAKADIIKAYMPFLNHKVNEYLAGMNMFLGFKIDENFEVEFTAPDRKGQSTFSLSKGQLTRVNLAVLFGLRDVANLKASVDSNLLVMDETIEPLSEQGVREIMEMMSHKFSSMNIFVVSQRASEFGEYFKDTVRYGLRGGFTTLL